MRAGFQGLNSLGWLSHRTIPLMPRHIRKEQFRELRTEKYAAFGTEFRGVEGQRICFPYLHYANQPKEKY